MANDNVIGLSISLDTSSLKAGLLDAGRRMQETAAQFKENTAGMDDWRKSTTGLTAKLKQLNSNLDIQKAVLELMEKEYKENTNGQDDMSKKAVELRTSIANQKAAIAQTTKSIEKYTGELENVSKAEKQAEKSGKTVNEVFKDQKEATKQVNEGFTVMKGTVANLVATGITKLISGFKQLITTALASAEATREYREDIGKLESAFTRSNKSTKSANKAYQELYSAIGETDTAVEAAQQIALLAKSEEDVAKWSKLATGVVGTFGDALKPETFYEAANETLNLGKATGAFTQMLEQTGISVEDFDEHLATLNTEEEKQAYMLAVSEKALGKAGEAYEKVNADIIKARKETAAYTEKQAELGAKMEPVVSTINRFKTELLDVILQNVNFEEVANKVNEVLTKFKDEIIPKVIEGFKWLKDNLPEIKASVIALGTAFATLRIVSIVTGIVKAVKAWTVATKGLTLAQKALNLVQKANPIGIIITLVTTLVTTIIYLWNTNEKFRNAIIKIWDGIVKGIKVAIDAVVKVFNSVIDFVKNNWQALLLFLVNPFAGAFKLIWDHSEKFRNFWIGLWNNIKSTFNTFTTWLSTSISNIGTWFVNLKNKITNTFSNIGSWFTEKFTQAWNGIKNAFSKVGTFFSGIWDTIKTKFTDIGQKVGDSISTAFKTAVNSLLSTAETVLNKPIKAINELREVINKVPGVNISKLKEFTLPRMAKGGVVDKATLGIFGEDGQEAVIPLERNLGWIKKISAQLIKDMNNINSLSGVSNSVTNNRNFTQIINAPQQPPIDELYRRTGSLLKLDKVVV